MSDLIDLVRGCTFDDFLFTPQHSVLERRDPSAVDLSCQLSQNLRLRRPVVSANMDTVTRAEMAITVAEEGGIGIIDRGFRSGDIEPQIREVEKVKRRQHGVIADPYTIEASASLAAASDMMRRTGVGSLVVLATFLGVLFLPKEFFFPALVLYVTYGLAKTVIFGLLGRQPRGDIPVISDDDEDEDLSAVEEMEYANDEQRRRRRRRRRHGGGDRPHGPPSSAEGDVA
jgi:hypothetical protein